MTKYFYSFLFLIGSLLASGQTTDVKYLSGKGSDDAVEWDFFCTGGRKSGEWNKIKVPSCWEMEGYGTFNYGHDKPKADESGLYKTTFEVPATWKGKRIFIVFEGSMTDTEIKVNGKQAGTPHQGAFYRFKREITKLVHMNKENLLEVKVNKMSSMPVSTKRNGNVISGYSEASSVRFTSEAVPNNFIEYTAIDARQHGELNADIFIDKKLSGIKAEIEIKDVQDQTMGKITSASINEKTGKISLSGKIDNIKPWSAEDPQLIHRHNHPSPERQSTAYHNRPDRVPYSRSETERWCLYQRCENAL